MTFGPARGFALKPPPGTRVRFTEFFLANVPFAREQSGHLRWTVLDCACRHCQTTPRVVAVNEPFSDPHGLYDSVPPELRPTWRHINWTNLRIVYDAVDHSPETPRQPR